MARHPLAPRTLAVAIALVMLPLVPHTAAAQDAPARHGFWAGIAFGGGQVETWSDQGPSARKTTLTASLRLGYVVVPALRLGLEANGWGLESGDVNDPAKGVTVNETLVIAQLYPWPSKPFFVKGGIGRGEYHTMHADDWGSSAWGATVVGLGCDFRVSRNVFATLAADWARGPLGDADPRVVTSTGRRFRAWSLHLGIQYH